MLGLNMQVRRHIGVSLGALALLSLAAILPSPVVAGPLDAAAAPTACSVHDRAGQGPSGKQYDRYEGSLFNIGIAFPATMTLPPQVQVGQILAAQERYLPVLYDAAQGRASPLYNCPFGIVESFDIVSGAPLVPGYSDVYQTGLQGIGFRIYYYRNKSTGEDKTAPATFSNPYTAGVLVYPFNGKDFGQEVYSRIEFIATANNIEAGVISASTVRAQGSVSGSVSIASPYRVQMQGDVTVMTPTCSAAPQSGLTMTLPDVPLNDLRDTGFTERKNTTIYVTCTSARANPPGITITANRPVAGKSNMLDNELTGVTTRGVGVELFYFDPSDSSYTVPTFGTVAQNKGYSQSGGATSAQWAFTLGARLALSNRPQDLRAGPVRGTATLTFTYD